MGTAPIYKHTILLKYCRTQLITSTHLSSLCPIIKMEPTQSEIRKQQKSLHFRQILQRNIYCTTLTTILQINLVQIKSIVILLRILKSDMGMK